MKWMELAVIPRETVLRLCQQPLVDDELSERHHFSRECLLVRFPLILHLLSALSLRQPYLISHKLQKGWKTKRSNKQQIENVVFSVTSYTAINARNNQRYTHKHDRQTAQNWIHTFLIFAFALSEECDGDFDIIFKGKRFEWLLDWCGFCEHNTVWNDMAVNNFLINKFWAWMWLQYL